MAKPETYYEVLTAAINDLTANGYDSAERIAFWSAKIREAAERQMGAPHVMEQMLRETLAAVHKRLIERGEIAKFHPGVARFTIDRLRPQIRAELDRRILAAADLIKINRTNAIEKTLQRFQGWSTSIPKGGSDAVNKAKTKTALRKAMAQLPFEERRVLIDQGHKLTASISNVIATDGGAIALIWRSHWRQAGYDYRPDHKERDGKVYLLRDSWAKAAGLVKQGPAGYYDEITAVGEEVYCRCNAVYLYALRELPAEMITPKGAAELERVRAQIAAMKAH